jgi:hypothetical protein
MGSPATSVSARVANGTSKRWRNTSPTRSGSIGRHEAPAITRATPGTFSSTRASRARVEPSLACSAPPSPAMKLAAAPTSMVGVMRTPTPGTITRRSVRPW